MSLTILSIKGAKHSDQMSNHQLLQRGSPPVTSYVIITVFRDAALCSAVETNQRLVEPAASIFKVPDYTASYPVGEQFFIVTPARTSNLTELCDV